jgi:hypothetical protein
MAEKQSNERCSLIHSHVGGQSGKAPRRSLARPQHLIVANRSDPDLTSCPQGQRNRPSGKCR